MKFNRMLRHALSAGILVATLVAGATIAESQGFDWPRWGGPDGNWISKEIGWNPSALADGPRVLWNVDVGMGYSSVAIKGNRLYTMGVKKGNNLVQCLSTDKGKTIWQYSVAMDSSIPQSTPIVYETSVYVLSKEGILFCLNAQDGKSIWQKDLVAECGAVKPFYGFAGSPVVEGDFLILTANTAGMAVKPQTGELVWTSEKPPDEAAYAETNGTDYSTPVISEQNGKRAALLYSWDGLSCMDVKTGKRLWHYKWDYAFIQAADPVIIGDRILLAAEWKPDETRRSVLLQIQRADPVVIWKSSDFFSDITNPVIIDGYIYGCVGGPHSVSRYACLRCLELDTGRLMWENPLGESLAKGAISLMSADGKLIVLNHKGMLFIAEASSSGFEPISKCELLKGVPKIKQFFTPPILCNGRIYCRNYAGDLICIDVSK